MKHRPKPGDDSDEDLEDAKKMKSDKFYESLMNEWDDSRVYTSTQVPAADILARYDDSGNRLMSDVTFNALNREHEMVEENDASTKVKLERALLTIKNLEQTVSDTSDTISQLEKSVETKSGHLNGCYCG